eukprot:TRINITY_DN3643_c0_g1_i2.p1 TRINITY_DN3643_c0_g1~~TRINITY_DN3643_c0_g1_i2.p1  ORF type:complete len:444 (-),score=53.79 TRINITY_DN3643_c0_g1_i2:168-1499(-)
MMRAEGMLGWGSRSSVGVNTIKTTSSSVPRTFLPTSTPQSNNIRPKYQRCYSVGDPKLAGRHYSPVIQKLWRDRENIKSSPQSPSARKPSETKIELIYQFSQDPELVDAYASPWGWMRVGRILEDLDALAGNVATLHCSGISVDGLPVLLATVTVDKITMSRPGDLTKDMKISGQVIWVGKSSMDILISVFSLDAQGAPVGGAWLVSTFTFVARNPRTEGAIGVPGLILETEEEKALFNERQKNYETTNQRRKKTLANVGYDWPDERSLAIGNQLLQEARPLIDMPALANGESILVSSTKLSNAFICHRQQRNIYGRIFGGFLMRKAFELASATAYLFCGVNPRFREIDHVVFRKPVNVGDLIKLESRVLYTCQSLRTLKPLMHVEVVVEVAKPEERSSFVSNTFQFTFEKPDGGTVKRVLPATLEEARTVVKRMEENRVDDL